MTQQGKQTYWQGKQTKTFLSTTPKTRNKMSFGKELHRLRKQQKRSQDDLAGDIGVNKKNISRWENEEVVPNVVMGAKVARALGVSLDSMLEEQPASVDPQWQRLTARCAQLPARDREVLQRVMEGLLAVQE